MAIRKRCFKDLEYELTTGMSKEELWEKVGLEDPDAVEAWDE